MEGATGGAGAVAGPPGAEPDFTSTLAVDVAISNAAPVEAAPVVPSSLNPAPVKAPADLTYVPVATAAPAPAAGETAAAAAAAAKGKAGSAEYEATEHKLSLADLAVHPDFVASRINPTMPSASLGLTSAEAAARLAAHGRNELTPPKETPEFIKFLKCYTDPFLLMLFVAGALCILASGLLDWDSSNLTLGIVLFVVVFLTGIMNYFQNRSTASVMAGFKSMAPEAAAVIRDGSVQHVPPAELVVGDVVKLASGANAPADARILMSNGLKCDFSSLTGEGDPIRMQVDAAHERPEESKNIAFSSSGILEGEAFGVVIRTGDHTMIGKIASLTANGGVATMSTLEADIHRFVKMVAVIGLATAIIFFIIGAIRTPTKLVQVFVNCFIVVVVANVPEGLPATVATCLTISAKRMGKRNVYIKTINLIETLGSASVIASDKTGTITQNKMTVVNLWFNNVFTEAARSGGKAPIMAPRKASADGASTLLRTQTIGRAMASGALGIGGQTQEHTAATIGRSSRDGLAAAARAATIPEGTAIVPTGGAPTSEVHAEYAQTIGRTIAGFDAETGRGIATRINTREASGGTLGAAGAGTLLRSQSSYYGSFSSFGAFAATMPQPLPTPAPGTAFGAGAGALSGMTIGAAARTALPAASWRRSNGYIRLVVAAGVCNRAAPRRAAPTADGEATAVPVATGAPVPLDGDASDQALYRFVDGVVPISLLRGAFPVIYSQPFNSTVKYSFAIVADPDHSSGAARGGAAAGVVAAAAAAAGAGSDTGRSHLADAFLPPSASASAPATDGPAGSATRPAPALAPAPAPAAPRGEHIILMKGAPEVILARCSKHLLNGEERPIGPASVTGAEGEAAEDFRASFIAAYERFGLQGMRVLAFAYKSFPAADATTYNADPESYPLNDLVFLGLTALVDPPKEGVADTVLTCSRAGIRFFMVTGDHPLTAEAIARKVNIIAGKTRREVAVERGVDEDDIHLEDPDVEAVVLSGSEIRETLTDDAAWDRVLCKRYITFARTTPQQKLAICKNLQRRGEIVAVTGDGTNDAPALKQANCGVAMAITGSAVSRAAADIILLDDNINSLVHGIEEGRALLDHLAQSIAYTLAHLWPELLPVLLNVAFGFPLGLPGLVLLTVDLVAEQAPAISFAYEPAEGSVMARPPRDPKRDRLVSKPLLLYSYVVAGTAEMLTCMFCFFAVYLNAGVPLSLLAFSSNTYWQAGAPLLYLPDGSHLDADAQLKLYYESVSAWYATLILCQQGHVWVCKTRFSSLFTHPLFENPITWMGMAIAVFVMLAVVFIPWLQGVFITGPLRGPVWPIFLIFWAAILAWTESIKWAARNRPHWRVVKWFAW